MKSETTLGPYTIEPFEPKRHTWEKHVGPSVLIRHKDGEAMECEISKLVELFDKFWKENF